MGRVICLVAALTWPLFAQGGSWSRPVALSTGGQGWEGAAAIDGASNSLALWDERTTQDQLWSRSKSAGGNWSPAESASATLQTTLVFPAVRITPTGFATAVWTDSIGVWTADRRSNGQWDAPLLLTDGATRPIFVMNARGDAAVIWTSGSPPGPRNLVRAALRPAGSAWTAPQNIASGRFVMADHAGISGTGAVIVTWESFNALCNVEGCLFSNFELHASRQDPGSGAWIPSSVLLGPDNDSHDAWVALDGHGRAILAALNATGAYVSATQSASSFAWSSFNTVVQLQNPAIVSDLASDIDGNVTMVYEVIGLARSHGFSVSGSMQANAWSPAVLLSSDTNVSQISFALAANGAGVATWLSSSPAAEIHAAIRSGTTGTWGSAVTVSSTGASEIAPEAVAVNPSGNAIVIYSGYNRAGVHTEYATSFTP